MDLSTSNRLLSSLAFPIRQQVLSASRHVSLPFRTSLYSAERCPEHAYFLTSGLASVVTTTLEGSSAEVAMIGREGLVGAAHLLGPATDPADCFMQGDGWGWKLPISDLRLLFNDIPELRRHILEFAQCYSFNLTQVACCNRLHASDARLARWLVMAQSRLQLNSLPFTHDLLAVLLGTSRPTVSLTTEKLQRCGVIQNVRGGVVIAQPDKLRAVACECLDSIQRRVDGLYR